MKFEISDQRIYFECTDPAEIAQVRNMIHQVWGTYIRESTGQRQFELQRFQQEAEVHLQQIQMEQRRDEERMRIQGMRREEPSITPQAIENIINGIITRIHALMMGPPAAQAQSMASAPVAAQPQPLSENEQELVQRRIVHLRDTLEATRSIGDALGGTTTPPEPSAENLPTPTITPESNPRERRRPRQPPNQENSRVAGLVQPESDT